MVVGAVVSIKSSNFVCLNKPHLLKDGWFVKFEKIEEYKIIKHIQL